MDDYGQFFSTILADAERLENADVPKSENSVFTDDVVEAIADQIARYMMTVIVGMFKGDNGKEIMHRRKDLVVCDMLEKDIKGLANSDEPLSVSDISKLMLMSRREKNDFNLDDYQNWDDGMIGKYAEFLKNYLYTYKDEATQVDPTIDPEEEHVGPMAQDIEQVAPDCVKETPEGVKVVDGDRLALVNAGVIGDLSREVIELRSRLAALEAKL